METLLKSLAFILFWIWVPAGAIAIVFGGSNLGMFGYPGHTCTPPYSKPFKPYKFYSQGDVDLYNYQVENYNRQRRSYLNCIREYVDNAKNDIERIREKTNEAINEANSG